MIGQKLKHLRDIRNRTQDEVAKALGTSRAAYSHLENDRNQPDNDMLVKLATYFDVTTDYLLGNNVPDWATNEDVLDLQEMLESNVNMAYGGEHLTEEEKQRVKDVLTGIFWEKIQSKKKK